MRRWPALFAQVAKHKVTAERVAQQQDSLEAQCLESAQHAGEVARQACVVKVSRLGASAAQVETQRGDTRSKRGARAEA